VLGLQVELIYASSEQTVGDAQSFSVGQKPLCFRVVFNLSRGVGILPDLFFVARNLIFQLSQTLTSCRQSIGLSVETLVAMAAHTTAFRKEIATVIQRVCTY